MRRTKADGPRRGRGRTPRPVKSKPAGADNPRRTSLVGFEISELRRLIRLVQRTGIGELEVTAGGKTVRISARAVSDPAPAVSQTLAAATAVAPPLASRPDSPAGTDDLVPVLSPMVGTFYRAPAPDADPYVELNDTVEIGQTVCIIEAMKLMNEIECETKGRVVRVLVENGQPVEYGQKLFMLEPSR